MVSAVQPQGSSEPSSLLQEAKPSVWGRKIKKRPGDGWGEGRGTVDVRACALRYCTRDASAGGVGRQVA